jgi:hypothetical protein
MERTKIYYLHNGDNKPFYIGKTKNDYHRLSNHKQTYGHNTEMVIISEVKDWKRWEKYYIKKYTDLGYDLTNKNEGGGGGNEWTKEQKHKLSLHPSRGKNISLANTGKKMAHKGKPFSEEHKAKIKATRGHLKGRKNTWQAKPVLQYDLENNFIREFGSVTEALYIMGKTGDGIGECCRGKYKTSYGYKWKYKN